MLSSRPSISATSRPTYLILLRASRKEIALLKLVQDPQSESKTRVGLKDPKVHPLPS
jgi:hypothetical protein